MNPPNTDGTVNLEAKLEYRFNSADQLTCALLHSSYVNEQPESDMASNERLEFLGDAVLNLAVSHLLMQENPKLAEGELSRIRAHLVNETHLAGIARKIDLGRHLLLGKGEELTDGRNKNSILADAVEAIIAAIYIDGGFDAAFAFVHRQYRGQLQAAQTDRLMIDFKSRLQEHVQSVYRHVPRYRVVDESGPDHDKTFKVKVEVAGISAEGIGKNKKMAEQNAARCTLALLKPADA
ncbi:MAG: ribonuclease III [Proteobacteria bacterium]|nr:MAG: ribonuclease III [Pseudomonadota bacterium]PIE67847.1 MAG: ribonuclease III [Deltaproteobacteria bacterium]